MLSSVWLAAGLGSGLGAAERMTKTFTGNYFEDFKLGQIIRHATPRTVTVGDVSLYTALYGPRFAVQSSDAFARAVGYPRAPVDDLLVFHIVFGKTVPDISLNAVANLGYANCRFLAPVFPGDTLSATSEVIGLKENSNRKTGIVYVRSAGFNDGGAPVLDYVRWVMVRKRDEGAPAPGEHVPDLPKTVAAADIGRACPPLRSGAYDDALAGSTQRFGDFAPGERIDHGDGRAGEEAEHQPAPRLYQNTAKVHFNQFTEGQGRLGGAPPFCGPVFSLGGGPELQRARQRLSHRGDQRRASCRAIVRRRHGVRLERNSGKRFHARPRRCRRL